MTSSRRKFLDVEKQVASINRKLTGWSNYFNQGPVSRIYSAVDYHTVRRLRQWLCKKHKVKGAGTSRFSAEYLYLEIGLVRLRWIKRNFP
jgi:hypothetical protein